MPWAIGGAVIGLLTSENRINRNAASQVHVESLGEALYAHGGAGDPISPRTGPRLSRRIKLGLSWTIRGDHLLRHAHLPKNPTPGWLGGGPSAPVSLYSPLACLNKMLSLIDKSITAQSKILLGFQYGEKK